jgi:hypothetical protein
LAGQAPRACYDLAATFAAPELPPESFYRELNRQLPRLTAALGEPDYRLMQHIPFDSLPSIRRAIDSIWRSDSLGVEWTLASMAASELYATRSAAEKAASQYRRLSGRAAPILVASVLGRDDSRRKLVLAAIRDTLTRDEQDIVFRMACDAAWQLASLRADAQYAKSVSLGFAPAWPANAREVLRLSLPLVTKQQRDVLESLSTAH